MRPHPCELRILPFYVYSILSKNERKESFISILNLPSFALRHPRNLLCLFFPPKQKLEREKTCVVHVLVLWVEKFGFQRAFAFRISLQQTRVFAFGFAIFPVGSRAGRKAGGQFGKTHSPNIGFSWGRSGLAETSSQSLLKCLLS